MTDPFCELFPKMAACHYHRYGMGGREDDRHAICILGIVNNKYIRTVSSLGLGSQKIQQTMITVTKI